MVEKGTPPQDSAFMTKLRRFYRPITIASVIVAIAWLSTCLASSFDNVKALKAKQNTNLAVFYIIMGTIYIVLMIIEVFGLLATVSGRASLVRIFAYFSVFITVMITVTGVIQIVVHYDLERAILVVCSVGSDDEMTSIGFFGPVQGFNFVGNRFHHSEVFAWCRQQFDRDSLTNIIVIPVLLLFSTLHTIVVFAYFRQLRSGGSAPREVVIQDVTQLLNLGLTFVANLFC